MALPASGPISFRDFNTDRGLSATAEVDIASAGTAYGISYTTDGSNDLQMDEFYGATYAGAATTTTTTTTGAPAATTTTTTTTTTTSTSTTTTTLPPSTAYATTPSHGNSNDACADITGNPAVFFYLSGTSNLPSIGDIVYTGNTLTTTLVGDGTSWYGLNTNQASVADYAIVVDASGEITNVVTCTGSETTTTTTTAGRPELSLGYSVINGLTACDDYIYSPVTVWGDDLNLSTSTVLYAGSTGGTLATSGFYADNFGYREWDGITLDTYISCTPAETSTTTTTTTASPTTTTTSTTTTTTAAPTSTTTTTTLPASTAYATTPSHGNSNDACADTTGNPAVFLHLAGSGTIPAIGLFVFTDNTLGDIYTGGDGSYIGFDLSQGVSPDYAVAINSFGEITDVVSCTGSETTTTTTTAGLSELLLGYDVLSDTSACSDTPSSYWGDGANLNNCTVLYTNSGGTIIAPTGYYADAFFSRYWNGSSFSLDGLCGGF